jgi:hypothetical protein
MTLQVRNGRPYCYRSVRRGKRVGRVYLGAGPSAEFADAALRLQQAERQAQRRAQADQVRQQVQEWANDDALIGELDEVLGILIRSALLSAGYHQHTRGEWRRRHYDDDDTGRSPDRGQ